MFFANDQRLATSDQRPVVESTGPAHHLDCRGQSPRTFDQADVRGVCQVVEIGRRDHATHSLLLE